MTIENAVENEITLKMCFDVCIFASLVVVHIGITSSTLWLKIWAITVGIKRYKLIIKKKKKKHNKIVLLAKTKLNTLKALISKAFSDPYINYENFFSINIVLRE